ncbi:PAS domain S-box-containing protein [Hydrogenophaga palleronii]|uniref:histidine kinase n=1 Tax=Hydrogenophaga palleronii TaxID=65655 RepID=A0ABU1WM83_9BURK|nr:PAS domain S-box protein [Hydrogenophaga palleronii]MDR7150410.1 PAS domain S-box-containing protein [Hydrogenophaga palleronii]
MRKPESTAESDGFAFPGEWLQALVEQTLAAIYVIQDGRFKYVNQEFANIFGYASPADIIDSLKISDLIAPEDRERVAENVRRRAAGEVPEMRYSFVGLRRDGRRIHIEVHGRAMPFDGQPAVIGLALDITERKLAEAASDEKLRALFEHSPLGIALVDQQGRHIECNGAYQRLLGCSDDVLKKTDMWSLVPARYADEVTGMRQAIENVGRYGTIELEYCRQDGQRVPVQTCGVRIAGHGDQHYVWSIVEDITERKSLESERAEQLAALKALNKRLQETQMQLLQAEKMSAVGQLAAGVAHEINNPVGFVKSNLGTFQSYLSGFLRLADAYEAALGARPPDDPSRQRIRDVETEIDYAFIRDDASTLLHESLDGIERVRRIVADLKDFSHPGEAQWQWADVHNCIDSTLNIVANELKYKADVVKDYGQLPPIRCIPFQLNQVFMNLLVNAGQAIPERGTIRIRSAQVGDSVWVEIEDTGNGIAPDVQARIFEPFFTTKPVGKGTGLGLAVSYGIVQSHHGDIAVRSTGEKGTVFRVTLPIDPASGQPEVKADV